MDLRMTFKLVELDSTTRRRTGREYRFEVETRQAAIDALLHELGLSADRVRVDPTRTLVEMGPSLWTVVAMSRTSQQAVAASLRRAGAKHKRVR
jgi:hypothetical protein